MSAFAVTQYDSTQISGFSAEGITATAAPVSSTSPDGTWNVTYKQSPLSNVSLQVQFDSREEAFHGLCDVLATGGYPA